MPTVYYRSTSSIFHKSEDCKQLKKKPARGQDSETLSTDLKDLHNVRPCRTCYPDAPRVKVTRRRCETCNKTYIYPCAHNGGVPVTVTYKTSYVGLLRDPGAEVKKQIYVWPDTLYKYQDQS